MHCSRVFRSSAPSDLLPSSPDGRPLRVKAAALDQRNGGSAPVAKCHNEGAVRQRYCPPGTSEKARRRGRSALRGGSRDAEEAGYLAEFLDRDECPQYGQAPLQPAQLQQAPLRQVPHQPGHFCQARFSRSSRPSRRRQAPANTRPQRCLARREPWAAAASRRIRPGTWPPNWPAGPRLSFLAR